MRSKVRAASERARSKASQTRFELTKPGKNYVSIDKADFAAWCAARHSTDV